MRLLQMTAVTACFLMVIGSAYAEQRLCFATKMQGASPQDALKESMTCTQKPSVTDDQVNTYINSLSDDDKADIQEICNGVPHSFDFAASEWLDPPKLAADGSLYSVYGSWATTQDDPMTTDVGLSLYDVKTTITLGSCAKTMDVSTAIDFTAAHNNQLLACNNGILQVVPGLTCESFDY